MNSDEEAGETPAQCNEALAAIDEQVARANHLQELIAERRVQAESEDRATS